MGVPRVEDKYDIRSVIADSLGNATHAVLIVLVDAIWIALDNGNGGDEARTYYVVYLVN